jgi:hypothetical protein
MRASSAGTPRRAARKERTRPPLGGCRGGHDDHLLSKWFAGATGLARFDGGTTTEGVAMLGRTGRSGEAASASANVGPREVRE